jgi:hypothetical protein
MLAGLVIGVFPLVIYFFLFIGCQNPDDEGSCVGALAAPLFEATMPFAFLVAFLVSMVGLVSWIVAVGRGPDARVWGFRIMLAGLVVALFPLLLSAVFSIGCENPFDESACSGAVALWGLLATLPIGFLVSIVGLVFWIVASGRKPKA